MIVVSDTSPFRYLVLVDAVETLPRVFGQVYAPPEVMQELQRSKRPELEVVRQWASSPPDWLTVKAPTQIDETLPKKLGRGEVGAISLALELKAERTLLDDWDARQAAAARDLQLTGTLTVLEEAACRDLLDIERTVTKLRSTNFRATEKQYQAAIERVRERKLAQEVERKLKNKSRSYRLPERKTLHVGQRAYEYVEI